MTVREAAAAPTRITSALRARAPRAPELEGLSFADVERRAFDVLPQLASLRPTLGATPLVPVPSVKGRGTVWLKIESANATGTVKARTAYALLCAAVARAGSRDVRLVEYSGGSLAVALAEFCGFLGLDLHLVVPHGAPERLRSSLRRAGATVSDGTAGGGFLGAMDEAAGIAEEERHLLLQHCAAEAVAMHREQTGREIVHQLCSAGAEPQALSAAVGTGGSLLGISQALSEVWPHCRALAVFPKESPYGDPLPPTGARRMNGTGGLGHGLRQPLLAPYEDALDYRDISYQDALRGMRILRASQGIAVSSSGAGAWLAASEAVDSGPAQRCAVAVVASRGTAEEWNDAAAE